MKRCTASFVLSLLAVSTNAWCLDTTTRLVGPVVTWRAEDLRTFDSAWCEAKFVEGSGVRYESGQFAANAGYDLTALRQLVAGDASILIRPTLSIDRATLQSWKALGEQRSGSVGPDLSLWFDFRVDGGPAAVAALVNALNALPVIEIAHPVPRVEPAVLITPAVLLPPVVTFYPAAAVAPSIAAEPVIAAEAAGPGRLPTPDFSGQQGYLYAPPVGLNATEAWSRPGGTGDGCKFIDVELCWTEDHEDFNLANNFYIGGATQDPSYETHGTAVLGEIMGQHNGYGIKGFAPAAGYGVVAVTVGEWPVVPHYFQEAVAHLSSGDTWLIELQMYPPGHDATPMEFLQVNYDVIWTSVWSLGIGCVEAGANGGQDLDHISWGGLFNRNLRDSGAIMVGAGVPTTLVAEWFTNYGSRMDVQGWGSSIVTTGYGDLYDGGTLQTRYTSGFSGTSGASPMVVGSYLCLQGIARAALGTGVDPVTLRGILHDTGTPYGGTRNIGPRPNLLPALEAVLNLTAVGPEGPSAGPQATAWPNPFTSSTRIVFSAAQAGDGSVAVYDAGGRLVRTLLRGRIDPGARRIAWDGRDREGRQTGSGIYFYRIEMGNETYHGRIVKAR